MAASNRHGKLLSNSYCNPQPTFHSLPILPDPSQPTCGGLLPIFNSLSIPSMAAEAIQLSTMCETKEQDDYDSPMASVEGIELLVTKNARRPLDDLLAK